MKKVYLLLARWLALSTLVAVAPAVTRAENWLIVAGDPSGARIEVDQDAISQVSDASFNAAWRAAYARNGFNPTGVGTVDCSTEAIHLSKPDRFGIKDIYPAGREDLGAVVWHVCRRLPQYNKARDSQIAMSRARVKCDSKSPEVAAQLCETSEDAQDALRVLYLRISQVERACNLSEDQVQSIVQGLSADVEICRVSTPNCGVGVLTQEAQGFGWDITRLALGPGCTYTPQALAKAAESLALKGSLQRFKGCVRLEIAKLDDRVSPADVIADGVFGACRDQLVPMLATSELFAKGLQPKIIASILLHRERATPRP